MKTKFEAVIMTVLATLTMASCEKKEVQKEPEAPYMDLVLVSEGPVTKTQMNSSGDNVTWSENEIVNFFADDKAIAGMNTIPSLEDGKLNVTLKNIASGTAVIDGYVGADTKTDAQIIENGKLKAFGIILPQEQNITISSYDPKADALVMETKSLDGLNLKEPVTGIVWKRLNAITKLTFTGLDETLSEDQVSTVEISTSNTALAGSISYDFKNGKFLAGDTIFNEGTTSNSILMQLTDAPALNADFAAWLVTAAIELPVGEKLTVTIETGKHTISKTFDIAEAIIFGNNRLNELPLDMADAKVSIKEAKAVWTETFDNSTDNNAQFADERWIVKDYLGWGRFCWQWTGDELNDNEEVIKTHNGILIHYYGTEWHLDAFVMIKEPFDITSLPLKEFHYTWGAGNTEIQTNGTDTTYERKYDFAKFEVVASTDFVDDPFNATWAVLHDGTTTVAPENYQFPDVNEENISLVSLAKEKKVYLGFRYTGGNAAYRIDNVKIY